MSRSRTRHRLAVFVLILVLIIAGGTAALLLATTSGPQSPPRIAVAVDPTGVALSPTVLGSDTGIRGFSGFYSAGHGSEIRRRFVRAVRQLGPETIRVFGGDADYYDWRTGRFNVTWPSQEGTPDGVVRGDPKTPVTLTQYASLLKRTGTVPIFDLNMVTMGSTPQADLEDQIEMLHRMEQLGEPIRYVELGNELYAPEAAVVARFPDGRAYARVANAWIPALKAAFPGVQVGVDLSPPVHYSLGSLTAANRQRYLSWNNGVLSLVRGENAVIIHTYWPEGQGLSPEANLRNPHNVATALRSPNDTYRALEDQIAGLHLNGAVQVWVTEWNLRYPLAGQRCPCTASIFGSWTQGLSNGEYALDLIGNPRIAVSVNHAAGGANPFSAIWSGHRTLFNGNQPVDQDTFSADGYVLSSLSSALHDQHVGHELEFGSNAATFRGWSFGNQAFLMNNGDRTFTLDLPPGLDESHVGTLISASPAKLVREPSDVHERRTVVKGSVTMPPYSVLTLLQGH